MADWDSPDHRLADSSTIGSASSVEAVEGKCRLAARSDGSDRNILRVGMMERRTSILLHVERIRKCLSLQ